MLALGPEHCEIDDVHLYTVGIACATIRSAYLGSDGASDRDLGSGSDRGSDRDLGK